MARISFALWNIVVFQLLIGKATPTGFGKNSIRGRHESSDHNEQEEVRIKSAIETERNDSRLGGSAWRELVEETSVEEETRNFPFIASLMDISFHHVCGGTFIAADMILTAASCETEV